VSVSPQVTCNCMSEGNHKLPFSSIRGVQGCGGNRGEQNNLPEQKLMQIILKYGMPICNPQGTGWP
jgi:hypothetical protein